MTIHSASLQHWILFSIFSLILVANTALEPTTAQLLPYDRELISQGQWWRVLSGHLMHLTWGHLWMNIAGLAFIVFFFGNLLNIRHWLILMVTSGLFISVVLMLTQAELYRYVGLSGVLHGLFVAGGIADIRIRPKEAWIFLAFITGKLAYEQIVGPLPGSEESAGGPVLVDAHFYGAIAGVLYMMGLYALQRLKPVHSA